MIQEQVDMERRSFNQKGASVLRALEVRSKIANFEEQGKCLTKKCPEIIRKKTIKPYNNSQHHGERRNGDG